MNTILIGFIHSGKTTYGEELSQKLDRPFIDTDNVIEVLFEKEFQKPLNYREIHRRYGNEVFRAFEKKALLQLLDVKESVIATGGGSVADPENVRILKSVGKLTYIKVPKAVLLKRFLDDPPTYANPLNPIETFERLHDQSCHLFEGIADFQIEVSEYGK